MFMTPTAELADVVLPVASCFEREALRIGFDISPEAQSQVQLRQAVIPPPARPAPTPTSCSTSPAVSALARSSGTATSKPAYRHQLAPLGITLEQLRAAPSGVRVPLQTRYAKYAEPDANGRPRGFATPSRRVELYSQTFLDHGYAPLPEFAEPQIGPGRGPIWPALPAGPDLRQADAVLPDPASRAAQLRRRAPHPEVDLHPAARETRGIANGDWVAIETPEGSVRARARFNASLDPRVVIGEHGWWQACEEIGAPGYDPFGPDGANLNLIIGTAALDPSAARRRTVPICARYAARPDRGYCIVDLGVGTMRWMCIFSRSRISGTRGAILVFQWSVS